MSWIWQPLAADDGGGIAGILAVTEAGDVLASTGSLPIAGVLAAIEAGDAVSASGIVAITGTVSIGEANDTLSAQGALAIRGTLSRTEAPDGVSASGALAITGTLAIGEQDDTPEGSGALVISAIVAVTEADDTLTAGTQMPVFFRRRGGVDERHEIDRREREWREDLRRIIDQAWRIADGEIDPVTLEEIPPPDLSALYTMLSDRAEAKTHEVVRACIAFRERRAEDEAIALLLLAA